VLDRCLLLSCALGHLQHIVIPAFQWSDNLHCMQVHNLTVRAKGKLLLENTSFTIAAGRRYGLAGPNG
jgi:ABC-type molybdenum transport system ATPase subunit/photorepair protein PhrA